MARRRSLTMLGAGAAAGVVVLAGCTASPAEPTPDPVPTTTAAPSPEADRLTIGAPYAFSLDFLADDLAAEGIEIDTSARVESQFSDTEQVLHEVGTETIDADITEGLAFLASFNERHGTDLAPLASGWVHAWGLFSAHFDTLDDLPTGATIAVGDDRANTGRALRLLADAGVITLAEGAGVFATVDDIVENPADIRLAPYPQLRILRGSGRETARIGPVLEFTTVFGIEPVLAEDPLDERLRDYAAVLVATPHRADDPLLAAVTDDVVAMTQSWSAAEADPELARYWRAVYLPPEEIGQRLAALGVELE